MILETTNFSDFWHEIYFVHNFTHTQFYFRVDKRCLTRVIMDNDDSWLSIALAMSMAAITTYINSFVFDVVNPTIPLSLRFVRPATSYMDHLQHQEQILADGGDRVIYDTFRMDSACLNALVEITAPFLKETMNPKEVVCVTLHWLATGASARAQEQFFLDKGYSTIHQQRCVGLRATLKSLVHHGFYGDDINDPARIAASKAAFGAKEPSLSSCIGAIDGTHMAIVVPHLLADRYRNRSGQKYHGVWSHYLVGKATQALTCSGSSTPTVGSLPCTLVWKAVQAIASSFALASTFQARFPKAAFTSPTPATR
jgi:hypothetical protein